MMQWDYDAIGCEEVIAELQVKGNLFPGGSSKCKITKSISRKGPHPYSCRFNICHLVELQDEHTIVGNGTAQTPEESLNDAAEQLLSEVNNWEQKFNKKITAGDFGLSDPDDF